MGLLLNDPFIQGKTLHFWQLHNFSSILIFKDQILLHINVSNYLNCIVSQYNFYLLVKNPILERDHLELIKKEDKIFWDCFSWLEVKVKCPLPFIFTTSVTITTSTPPPLLHHHHFYTTTTTTPSPLQIPQTQTTPTHHHQQYQP